MCLVTETHPAIPKLRRQLDQFYRRTTEYSAFESINHKPECWRFVRTTMVEILKRQPRCRVLEIGAGRSGFARYLGDLRDRTDLVLQDVTPRNREFLEAEADFVLIGDLSAVAGDFDVVFSTYVLEHTTNPKAVLETCFSRLREAGSLFVFCPRYDFPFYLPRSVDHYSRSRRCHLALCLLGYRLRTLLTGRPAFIVHTDPALLHLEWARDRDAVHWVSLWDLQAHFRDRAALTVLPQQGGGGKDSFVKRFLTVSLQVTKASIEPGSAAGQGSQ